MAARNQAARACTSAATGSGDGISVTAGSTRARTFHCVSNAAAVCRARSSGLVTTGNGPTASNRSATAAA